MNVKHRPRKVDSVLAVGVSSSKPNNPRKKQNTHSKRTRIKTVYLVLLRDKNKFNGFSFFLSDCLAPSATQCCLAMQTRSFLNIVKS